MTDMTTKIDFGKDRFHQQNEMIDWCRTYIGSGKWYEGEVINWQEIGDWSVDSMFGNTHFLFRCDADATFFKLRWL